LGQGRAFQNARLFGSLTVRETLMVALEARQRSLFVPSVLALPPSPGSERRKRKESEEIISYLGLGRYADSLMSELSTGTRRIVELGALIALFERAVGFYASLVGVNAYHQPGVEAGKKAAGLFLDRLSAVRAALSSSTAGATAEEIAGGLSIDPEDAFHILNHLSANGGAHRTYLGATPAEDRFARG
jgi:hypothetical protein